jgi:arylsulfatase A-like enzyme
MGIEPQFHPNKRGFDDYDGFLGGGHKYFPEQFQGIYERQRDRGVEHINDYVLPLEHNGQDVKETEYITDGLSREAVRFVKEASAKEQPFFLYLAYNAPHSPLEAKQEDLARFASIKDEKRRSYAAMVYAVDRGVDNLVQTMKAAGELDNTLIVFLSDNGGKLGLGANNAPLREGKGSTCEGGYRVPMFFHWPGNVPAGGRYDHPVSALDFYPTFARLARAKVAADKQLDGKHIWDDFQAGRSPRKGEMVYALRHRDGYSDVGARRDQWKICRTYQAPWKLFNIEDDIGERRDLSDQYPERLREMVSEAEEWSQSHAQPRWFDNLKAAREWKAAGMPKYDATFMLPGGRL